VKETQEAPYRARSKQINKKQSNQKPRERGEGEEVGIERMEEILHKATDSKVWDRKRVKVGRKKADTIAGKKENHFLCYGTNKEEGPLSACVLNIKTG